MEKGWWGWLVRVENGVKSEGDGVESEGDGV